MKIGMLTSSYPRFEGDIAGTFVRSLAESIAELGHEVHVLAAYDPLLKEPPSMVHVHRIRYAARDSWYQIGYAKSLQSDVVLKKAVYPLLLLYAMAMARALWQWHRRVGLDVIHAHWVVPGGGVGALVSAMTGVPLVISLHGSDVFMVEKNPLANLAARWAFARAKQVTGCSSDLLVRAEKHGLSPAKRQLIPYGVSDSRFYGDGQLGQTLRQELGIAPDAPVVLGLGRLVYKKGFQYLVQAIPDMVKQFPSVKVIIAGAGPLHDELLQQANELGIADHLMLVQGVPWDDTVRYFDLCDVFVLPSIRDHKGNVDGLPNVLLEAMACGKPVVASRLAGIPEVLVEGQNGLLVEEKNADELGSAIVQLLSQPELAKSCGAANRLKAQGELAWGRIAARMVEVYERAIGASV